MDGPDRVFTGDREYDVRGITTVRVNREGKVTMHEDRIVEKGEFSGRSRELVESADEADGGAYDEKREAQMDEEDEDDKRATNSPPRCFTTR